MPDLKLARLPDRTPIKLTISIFPELHAQLEAYCRVYAEAYGSPAPMAEIIPPILSAFLESDREFARRQK